MFVVQRRGPNWSCLSSTGCDVCGKKGQTDHRKLYHGTSAAFAKAVERNGFKVSKDGMFGPGVYTTSDIEKAAILAAQHKIKRTSAWSLCWTWILAGARRVTLWVVLNLINLIVSADGGCRRTMSPRRCLLVLGSNEQKLWFATLGKLPSWA